MKNRSNCDRQYTNGNTPINTLKCRSKFSGVAVLSTGNSYRRLG